MVTAKTSRINLPPDNSRRYSFDINPELEIGYNEPITKAEYESRFGGVER